MTARIPILAAVSAALVFAAALAARAGDEQQQKKRGTAHTWSSLGSGVVGEASDYKREANAETQGVYIVELKAKGVEARSFVEFGSSHEVSIRRHVSQKTSYQLSVEPKGQTCEWTASGNMNWVGDAFIGATAGYASELAAVAGLIYSGDLSLRGAANVAVHTGSAFTSEFAIGASPELSMKVARKSSRELDRNQGGDTASNGGKGPDARVDVSAAAGGSFSGTPAVDDAGSGDGRGTCDIAGKVVLTVSVLTDTPTSGPSTPGGDPGKETYSVFIIPELEVDPPQLSAYTGHPNEAPGSKPVFEGGGTPEKPKPVRIGNDEIAELEGTDSDGNQWTVLSLPSMLDD
jgi:hypothetical protein